MSDKESRARALMTLLSKVDEKEDQASVEFNDQLAMAASLSSARDALNKFDTGIKPNRILGYKGVGVASSIPVGAGLRKPLPGEIFAMNLPAPPPKSSVQTGEKIIVNRLNIDTMEETFTFGEFIGYANKIVTFRDLQGKLRHVFNSPDYSWKVRPVEEFPENAEQYVI